MTGILVFVEELSGNMELMEVSGVGSNFLCGDGKKEGFVFWFLGKEHNNQIFQMVLQGGQLLGLLLHIFL